MVLLSVTLCIAVALYWCCLSGRMFNDMLFGWLFVFRLSLGDVGLFGCYVLVLDLLLRVCG